MLKAKRVKITNHPVIKRLVQFRELISSSMTFLSTLLDQRFLAEMKDEQKIKPKRSFSRPT